jgi:hypothetical protein
MPDNERFQATKTLEELCRQASVELDSRKLNVLIEEIDRMLDEQHKEARLRRPA